MLKNGLFNVSLGLVRAGLTFAAIPILIRAMDVQMYGTWVLASSILSVFMFAEAGLPASATVFVSGALANEDKQELQETISTIFYLAVCMSLGAASCLCLSAGIIGRLFPSLETSQSAILTQAIQFGSLAILAQLIQQVCIGIEQAYQEYKIPSSIGSMQWVSFVIGWIVLAYNSGTAVELSLWQCCVSLCTMCFHIRVVLKLSRTRFSVKKIRRDKATEILKYGSLAWVTVMGRALFTRGDRLIVGSLLTPTALVVYSTIMDYSSAITSFSSLAVQPIMPIISSALSQPKADRDNIRNQIKKSIWLNALAMSIASLLLITLSSFILKFSLSRAYSLEYSNYFKLSIVISSIISMNSIGYWILFGAKRMKLFSIYQLTFGLLSLLSIYVGCSVFGLWGAILGNLTYAGTIGLSIIGLKCMEMELLPLLQSFSVLVFILISSSVGVSFLESSHSLNL